MKALRYRFRVERCEQPTQPGQNVGPFLEWLGTFGTRDEADYTARMATATWPANVITVEPEAAL